MLFLDGRRAGRRRRHGAGVRTGQPGPAAEATAPVPVHQAAKPTSCCRTCRRCDFLGVNGHTLLLFGLVVARRRPASSASHIYHQVQELPVHQSMARDLGADLRDVQDLPASAGQVPADPRALHRRRSSSSTSAFLQRLEPIRVVIILLFSLIGIGGSYGVAWFGIRINTFANSRTAFASLRGQAVPDLCRFRCAPA